MTNQLPNNFSHNPLQEDILPQEDQRPKTHLQLQFIIKQTDCRLQKLIKNNIRLTLQLTRLNF